MGQINTNNYPTVDSLVDTDLLIVENATHGTGTTTPKQLRENAIGTDPLQTTAQTVTGAINELKNSGGGGDSYALVGMGQVTSYSNKVAETNVYLHRAPKEGDRLFINFQPTITDSDAQIKIYDEASGTAYTLSFNFWASGSKLAGLCLLEVQDNGFGTLGLTLKYSFEGGTNYTAGTGIEINGSAISNTAPNYGVDVDGATISSVSSGNLGTYVGESKYLILYFSASASPYSGGYTLTLSYSGSVARYEYGTLYDGSSRYNSNISAGTMLLCEVTETGSGSSADPVHVNIIGKIDPNSSGGGNTVSKTRYQISSSSWSSSANSDGYYTATKTLSPTIGSSPDVYLAGSADGTQPTSTEEGQFAYVKRCKVNGSTLTLYATSKPSSTFYIWVEGVNGTGSGDIVGNIIKPNGESSGGGIPTIDEMTSYSMSATTRFTRVSGGYKIVDNKCYINVIYKLQFNLSSANTSLTRLWDSWGTFTNSLSIPNPKNKMSRQLQITWVKKDPNDTTRYIPCSFGTVFVTAMANGATELTITSVENLDGTTDDIRCIITGEYDI